MLQPTRPHLLHLSQHLQYLWATIQLPNEGSVGHHAGLDENGPAPFCGSSRLCGHVYDTKVGFSCYDPVISIEGRPPCYHRNGPEPWPPQPAKLGPKLSYALLAERETGGNPQGQQGSRHWPGNAFELPIRMATSGLTTVLRT